MLQEFLSPHGALTLHGVYVWIFDVSILLSCTIQGMTECEDRDVPGIAFMHARALWEPVNYLQLSLVFIQVFCKTGLTASCSSVKMTDLLSTLTRSTPGVSTNFQGIVLDQVSNPGVRGMILGKQDGETDSTLWK